MAMDVEVVAEAIPRDFTMSKLPSYRSVDVALGTVRTSIILQQPQPQPLPQPLPQLQPPPPTKQNIRNQSAVDLGPTTMPEPQLPSQSLAVPRSGRHANTPRLSRHLTFPLSGQDSSPRALDSSGLPVPKFSKTSATPTRYHPASSVAHARINKQNNAPPPSMITRGYYNGQALESDNTKNWVHTQASQQQTSRIPTSEHPPASPTQQQEGAEVSPPGIAGKAVRGFKSPTRKSAEMSRRSPGEDPDETLRPGGLDGCEDDVSPRNSISHRQQHQDGCEDDVSPRNSISHRQQHQSEQDKITGSDESDIFLNAARAEGKMARQSSLSNSNNSPSRIDSRFSRSGQRELPSVIASSPSTPRRRGSQERESPNGSRLMEDQQSVAQALTYRTAKDQAPEDVNRNRYTSNKSSPITPRIFKGRDSSPDLPNSYGARRTIPEISLSARTAYRQSNLSYTAPRVYNSSPLVSRITDMDEIPETPRATEGTESSVSTTAPSTVWDELEDLKSRIHRLELTGKLPPTSGAAMSRASHDRPPTATTTVTTISTSPKRARGNSVAKSMLQDERTTPAGPPTETHPLLHDALEKSKPLLSAEVFKALEAAASDALAIASMMGTSGQPGPISSSQSTVGGSATVSDRQVRRKADSMCRSLTELCLALSEAQPVSTAAPISQLDGPRPSSKDRPRISIEVPAKRPLAATDFLRAQSTPRALSRLEERRSSLLNTSALPSPRYNPSEAGGRRTSLFLRTPRRTATDPPETEGDEFLFRAPSRAGTEIGRLRSSREYSPKQPTSPAVQSSLPVRRHYTSTSLTNTIPPPMPPVSNLGGRRFLERATPERDTSSVVSRLNEAREQRKSSISGGFLARSGSMTKKSRQSTPNDSPTTAQQAGNYQ